MTESKTMEELARLVFDEEWDKHIKTMRRRRKSSLQQAVARHPFGQEAVEVDEHDRWCWLLRDMVRLIEEQPDQSVEELRPVIHRMMHDHGFVDESGDHVADVRQEERLEACTDLMVRVLHRVRHESGSSSDWSTMPVTPQMFG